MLISQIYGVIGPLGGKLDFFSPLGFEAKSYFDSKTSKLSHIRSETLLPGFMILVIKSNQIKSLGLYRLHLALIP